MAPKLLLEMAMPRKNESAITVLVVDDEEWDRTRTSNALSAEGYRVLEAESYSDAMAVFEMNRQAITFLVADLSLPDGNGCALAIGMRKLLARSARRKSPTWAKRPKKTVPAAATMRPML